MIRNNYILKTVSLFLSFWMLSASSGLSVSFHYCEGKIVDWSLIGQELECDHEEESEENSSCCEATHELMCHSDTKSYTEDNCCESGEAQMSIQQEFNVASEDLKTETTALFLFSLFSSQETKENLHSFLSQEDRITPLPINRRLASLQTFLL